MPTYEYACGACGHEFELQQSIKDDPIKACPKCKKRKVQRLISQGNFILKGGGWYSDLYSGPSNAKKDSAAKTDKAEASSDSKSKSSSDTTTKPSSEAKPKKKASGGEA